MWQKLIWADFVGITVGLLILVGALAVWFALLGGKSNSGFEINYFDMMGNAELVTTLPLWLLLRIVDWFAGGPRRRSRKIGHTAISDE